MVAVRHASLKQCVTTRGAYTLSIRIAPPPRCHNTFELETTLRDKKVNIQAPLPLPTTLVQEHVTPYFTCFQHSPPIPHLRPLQSRLHFLHYSPRSPPSPSLLPLFLLVCHSVGGVGRNLYVSHVAVGRTCGLERLDFQAFLSEEHAKSKKQHGARALRHSLLQLMCT